MLFNNRDIRELISKQDELKTIEYNFKQEFLVFLEGYKADIMTQIKMNLDKTIIPYDNAKFTKELMLWFDGKNGMANQLTNSTINNLIRYTLLENGIEYECTRGGFTNRIIRCNVTINIGYIMMYLPIKMEE